MKYLLLVFVVACASLVETTPVVPPLEITPAGPELVAKEITKSSVSACLASVPNRGVPVFAVVKDIIEAVKATPLSVFEVNDRADIYSSVSPQLGPYTGLKNRAAVMAHVMIIAAGRESSWNYAEGRDMSATNTSACTAEAGLYQTSGNMNTFDSLAAETLVPLQAKYCKSTTCAEFQRCTKEPVKAFVHGHFMRALRVTIKHWGPIVRKELHVSLTKACVKQIEQLL